MLYRGSSNPMGHEAYALILNQYFCVDQKEQRVRKMDNPFMVSGQHLLDFFEIKQKAKALSLFANVCRKVQWANDVRRFPFVKTLALLHSFLEQFARDQYRPLHVLSR